MDADPNAEVVDGRALRGIRSRESIVTAADAYFRVNGYAGTSLREFSASIGRSHSGVLRHFPSKSHLLIAVLDHSEPAPLPEAQPANQSATDQFLNSMRARNPHRTGLYLSLLGEATSSAHPAHDTLATEIHERTTWIDHRFPGNGALLSAAWDGLELLARYLGDEVDPAGVAQQMMLARSERRPGSATVHRLLDARTEAPAAESKEAAVQTSRDRILAAAASAFAEEGYRAVSIRTIAARLGIAHGTILYHFDSKEALLDGVLTNLSGAADATPMDSVGPDSLARFWSRVVANESRTGVLRVYSSLLCEASSPSHPAHEFFRARYKRVLKRMDDAYIRLIAENDLQSTVAPRTAAIWTTACWDGLQIHRDFTSSIDVPTMLFAELERILW